MSEGTGREESAEAERSTDEGAGMKLRKLLITGSRDWKDRGVIRRELEREKQEASKDGVSLLVLHGNCRGADTLADEQAKLLAIHTAAIDALWDFYAAAGPIRNSVMVALQPDRAIAFHEDLENSRGTKDCVAKCRKAGIAVREVEG